MSSMTDSVDGPSFTQPALFIFYLHNQTVTLSASAGLHWHVSCVSFSSAEPEHCRAFRQICTKINCEVVIMGRRTVYVERLSAHMVEWDSQIDLIKDKAESTTPETRIEYSNAI